MTPLDPVEKYLREIVAEKDTQGRAFLRSALDLLDEARAELAEAKKDTARRRRVQLGVIEFHSERLNPGLIERFYAVRDDLTAAGCIVDIWLLDIASVLKEFGYEMEIYSTVEPDKSQVMRAAIDAAPESCW